MSNNEQTMPPPCSGDHKEPIHTGTSSRDGHVIQVLDFYEGYGGAPCRRFTMVFRGRTHATYLRAFAACLLISLLLLCNLSLVKHPLERHYHSTEYDIEAAAGVNSRMPSHCDKYADWTEENSDGPIAFPKTVLTSFSLPLSSELLFLVSNSSKSRGIVRITKNGLPGSSDVLVDVRMTYHYDEVFEYTKICSAQLDDGEYGVALFDIREVPKGRKYYTDFEITVNIPPSTTGVPTFIRGFRGDMLLFAYELGYMQDFVFFDTISLDAGNMSINAMALSARSANLHNERAEISGSFNVSELLVLHAVASLITVDVKLLNTDQDNPTELQMCTFFSDIRVTLELISTSETGTGGAFKVNASTDFRPVDIQTIRAPIDHVLDLTVQTKGGEITVTLPSTWEGEFRAASAPILGGPRIEADKNVPDPSGRGRKRDLAWVGNEPGVVEGHAWWVPQEERDSKMGNVTIVSAYLSPILRF